MQAIPTSSGAQSVEPEADQPVGVPAGEVTGPEVPGAEESAADEPASETPGAEAPGAEESAVDEPASETPGAEEPAPQESASKESQKDSKERLPQASFIPVVPYPPEALAEGRTADVVLVLDISEEGKVLQVSVAESGGAEFDASVVQVAPSFLFLPALNKRGEPEAARIQYRYRFTVETAPQLSVEGQVLIAGIREPVTGAFLRVSREGQPAISAESDEEGRFRFAGLAPGLWTLTAVKDGFQPEGVEVEVEVDSVQQVTLYAVKDRPWLEEASDETLEVVGKKITPELTERVLSADEIRYLPGTNGDVVRAIQNLPGIARPPLNIGQLIIRGTAPEDSRYYLDGMQIPIVFHFSGLSTVINGDSIQEVSFLSGNYGVRYGRALGGVVDIRAKSQLPERSNGYLAVDLFQTTGFVEQKIGKKTALTVSGRRSYFDAILNPILNGMGGGGTVQAPRYYDFQTRLLHQSERYGTFDVFFLASDDRFRFIGPPEEGEEEGEVAAGLTTTFQKLRFLWKRDYTGGWRSETSFIVGPEAQTFEFGGGGEAYEKNIGLGFRQEIFRAVPQDKVFGWRFGLDILGGQERFLYDVPLAPTDLDVEVEPEQGEALLLAPAAYVETTIRLGVLDLVPGLRFDGWVLSNGFGVWSVDPRLGFKLQATPTTVVKGSVGRFSQFPRTRQVLETYGKSAKLNAQWSLQTSLGVEQQIIPELSVEVNVFYNHLQDLVVGREDAFRFYSGPPPIGPFDTDTYANDGIGRVCGLELLAKLQTSRAIALLSATFGNSARVDRPGDESELFAYDQPFVVNALGSYKLPKRWRIGARVRVSAGNPYTPINNRVYDLDSRSFIPVFGERDAARLPAFWSVDLRFDKDYVFRKWTLTTYLDLQNAFNTQNVEVMGWTYDYGEENSVTSIPITPAFGLRGEW